MLNFCFALLQIMREVMDVETSIPVPSRVEEGEQSLMDESHADDSYLV